MNSEKLNEEDKRLIKKAYQESFNKELSDEKLEEMLKNGLACDKKQIEEL